MVYLDYILHKASKSLGVWPKGQALSTRIQESMLNSRSQI